MIAAGFVPVPLEIEGVSGGQPVPVSGSVTIVDGGGSVTVDSLQLPAALAAGGGLKIEGVAGGVAVPISAASLPLPAGAATETTLAALNTKVVAVDTGAVVVTTLPGSPSQEHTGAASPHAARLSDGAAFYDATKTGQLPAALAAGGGLKIEGVAGGVAVPVSGTVTVAQPVAVTDNGGSLTVDSPQLPAALAAGGGLKIEGVAGGVVVPISAASLPLPTGAATETTLAALNTKVVAVDTGAVVVTTLPGSPSQEHTAAASPHSARLSDGTAFYDATKTGQLPAALAAGGGLKIEGVAGGVAVPISGTVTVNQPVAVTDNAGSLTIDSPQLPAALAAGGGLKIEGVAGGVAVPVSGTLAVTNAGTFAVQSGAERAEDTSHVSGHTGMFMLGVRNDNLVAATSTNGDYSFCSTDDVGRLHVRESASLVDNAAFVDGTSRVEVAGYLFDEAAGTALTENDTAAARIDSKRAQVMVFEDATTRGQRAAVSSAGALSVATGAERTEDSAHSDGHTGLFVLGVRNDNGDTVRTGANGDYGGLAVDDRDRLVVVAHPGKATSTDDYTGTANGTSVDISHRPCKHFAMQVSGVGGTPTGWTVQLQGSLDGVTWTLIISHTASADALGSTEPSLVFTPYNFVRSSAGGITLNGATALRVIWVGVP